MDDVKKILLEIINTDPRRTVEIVNAACRLILAERERCALLVEGADMTGLNSAAMCREAARKIREG